MRRALLILVMCGFSWVAFADIAFPRGRDVATLIRTRSRTRSWNAIVVHHTASAAGSARSIDAYHRHTRRFPRGLAYHFVIGNGRGLGDGEIEVGPRWLAQHPGAHVASALRDPRSHSLWDEVAIGIVLVGNFESSRPSRRQRATLEELVRSLRARFRIPTARIFGHGELEGAHTECPSDGLESIVHRLRS